MGLGGQFHAPAALPTGERTDTHYIGDWVEPRAGLEERGRTRLHRDSISVPSST